MVEGRSDRKYVPVTICEAMVPCLEQPYAGFRLKLCQIKTPSKKDIRSSKCGISNLNMA